MIAADDKGPAGKTLECQEILTMGGLLKKQIHACI